MEYFEPPLVVYSVSARGVRVKRFVGIRVGLRFFMYNRWKLFLNSKVINVCRCTASVRAEIVYLDAYNTQTCNFKKF